MAPKARLLAIDDQAYFRNLIEGLLSDEGYQVQTTAHGPGMRELIERDGPFDLVLLDWVTPISEGLDLVSELREHWPEQEVIVLSGAGEIRRVVASMQQGAADYLLKPIDRESLLGSIAAMLARREQRLGQARPVDENQACADRLSLLERALPLHGLSSAEDVGRSLLELLCSEARASEGELWLRESGEGGWRRSSARGPAAARLAPEGGPASVQALREDLEQGRTLLRKADENQEAVLFVPCMRDGELLAIARLAGAEGEGGPAFATGCIEACEKVSEIGALAIFKALQLAELRRQSFKDDVTGLPGRAFIEQVAQTEIQKASRYGRALSYLAVVLDGLPERLPQGALQQIVHAMTRTLRTTDVLASENARRFWLLVTDTLPFGSVVLKRRLAQRLREVLEARSLEGSVAIGLSCYPADGDSVEALTQLASERADFERTSVARELGIHAGSPLAEIQARLLERARPMPPDFVAGAAELVIGELSCHGRDQSLLLLAPGAERSAFLEPLQALGEIETATEVFLACNGDTLPNGPRITPLVLPPEVSLDTTWIVRFGEAPPYALVAGPPDAEGRRPVYHSSDPVLVEHVMFRLREEVGFGMGS